MAYLNDWGNDLNENSIGDSLYDSIEEKARKEAKDMAKDGIDKAGHAASQGLDKATDHIKPVKEIKDKIKEKLSNNPITRAKAAVKKLKEKAKTAVKNGVKKGAKAVGKAAVRGVKAAGRFIARHPGLSILIGLVLIAIMGVAEEDNGGSSSSSDSSSGYVSSGGIVSGIDFGSLLQTGPSFVNIDGISDSEMVVILMDDCVTQEYVAMAGLETDKDESAKFLYSIFRSYGFNNVSIAGMFANLDIESGLDPSAIEGIFGEYGFLGAKKAEALISLNNYTLNTLFPKYVAAGKSINRDGYKTVDPAGNEVYYCGIGFAQWTGGNAKVLLSAAATLNLNWYDRNFQTAYLLSDCMYRPGFFAGWKDNQEEDYHFDESLYHLADYATQAEYDAAVAAGRAQAEQDAVDAAKASAVYFAHNFEGNSASDDNRKDNAEAWYAVIKDWGDDEVDSEYADSIIALAAELGAVIEFEDIRDSQYRCLNGNVFDNSSLAAAAVSLAWPRQDMANNNGTNLYQTVLSTIWPTNYDYKACDRTVACAVVWSGTDDDFPIGNTPRQMTYMSTSSKWEYLGPASSLSMDDLQAGDIFILNGHTFMYVTLEMVQNAYSGEANPYSDSVSGSLGERSPSCDGSTSSIMGRNGRDWESPGHPSRGVYDVYRCVDPDHSTKWTSVGSGVTP